MPPYKGFVGSSYTSQSLIADAEKCVNWYVERLESENAKSPMALYPTPGVETFAQASQSGWRATFTQQNRTFAVVGGKLKEVAENGTLTDLADVALADTPATMTTNGDGGDELFVTSGTRGYVYNLGTGTFANPIDAVDFGGMLDTFFIGLDTTSSTLKISDSNQGTVWDGTKITQRSDASDPWRSMVIVEPEIWLFGEKTTDIYFNGGGSGLPFRPRSGIVIPQGIKAPHSVKVLKGQPIWLGNSKDGDGVVYSASGYAAVPISTHALDYAMSQMRRIDDAVAFVYEDLGHAFYVLNFPSGRATWVYDSITGLWHERGTWNPAQNRYDAWHVQCHTLAFGKHLFGDPQSGRLYHGNVNFGFDAEGKPLRRLRRGPGRSNEQRRVFVHNFQLDVEAGLGLQFGQGSDPNVCFRKSKDGGKTWGNERWRSAGKVGKYQTRVRWNRVGTAQNFVPEIVVTDPIPWRIMGAAFNVPDGKAA